MRKIKEVLRLKWECGLGDRVVAATCSVSRSTVSKYVRLARQAGLSWPLPEEMDDDRLEALLFQSQADCRMRNRHIPDWAEVHRELRYKGVTLQLLWEEYRQTYPDGLRYSQYCTRYRQFCQTLDLPMRQCHKAGEKLFVDFCGQTMPITDQKTGKVRQAEIFVAVLGASNYTYVEACWAQSLPSWIMAHVRAFQFFGGAPSLLICDNLKSGVISPDRYEPEANHTYEEMAAYYGCALLPARVRKPKDKAKVEKGVQDVERRILAALRHRTFFSINELNRAIAGLLVQHNEHTFQKLEGSRLSLFEQLDKPALQPLPIQPYEYAQWKKARVNVDYHVAFEGNYYSVPYQLVNQTIDIRATDTGIECFHKSKRVASHLRLQRKGQYATVNAHMPKTHQDYAEWSPQRLVHWAQKIGPQTALVVENILRARPHPQQGFRACLGIMRLGKEYGSERLEAACTRALAANAASFRSVQSILKSGLDKQPLQQPSPDVPPVVHDNIRGPHYYSQTVQEEEQC